MSRRKLARLLNLTLCLMATSRSLTVREIAELVEGYEPGESPESEVAFRRMFERDKEELRELGVPLEAGIPRSYEDEIGYRIPKRDYALPDLHLDADEAAALGLAARLWSSASLATPSATALRVERPPPRPARPQGAAQAAGRRYRSAGRTGRARAPRRRHRTRLRTVP